MQNSGLNSRRFCGILGQNRIFEHEQFFLTEICSVSSEQHNFLIRLFLMQDAAELCESRLVCNCFIQ